jgi:hypothetical protein
MSFSTNDKVEMQELMGRYVLASDVLGPEAIRDIFVEDSRLVIESMLVDVQNIDNIVNFL